MQCINQIQIQNEITKAWTEVPCGKCIYCMETKRSVWTYRILQELKVAETARFVTLTYDEKHIPYTATYGGYRYGYQGKTYVWEPKHKLTNTLWKLPEEINGHKATEVKSTLVITELQLMLKKIRNHVYKEQMEHLRSSNKNLTEEARRYLKQSEKTGKWSPKLRYFACGEYGNRSKTERPHWHIILFNAPLRWYKYDTIHEEWYSNKLEELWGKGIVNIQEVGRGTAQYVAKYTIKSLLEEWHKNDIRTPPFAMMSKNPGIGANYTIDEQNRNYFTSNEISHTRLKGGYIQPIGRYYKDKIWPKEKMQELNGVQIWPEARINATKKTHAYVKDKATKELNEEIRAQTGDILQAEETIKQRRREAFENAIRTKRNKQLKNGGTL